MTARGPAVSSWEPNTSATCLGFRKRPPRANSRTFKSTKSEPGGHRTPHSRSRVLGHLALFALQLGVVVFEEAADVVGEAEQPLPLLDVERHGHPLQAVDADRPFLAHLAVQGAALGRLLGKHLGR